MVYVLVNVKITFKNDIWKFVLFEAFVILMHTPFTLYFVQIINIASRIYIVYTGCYHKCQHYNIAFICYALAT